MLRSWEKSSIQNKVLTTINTHLAWGPTPKDEGYKLKQGEKLFEYIKTIAHPFILSGDFNVSPDSKIVKNLNTLARNHTVENKVTNTLNPSLHRVPSLFPKGIAVDYIYTEKSIKANNFRLINTPNLSDHYGLSLTFEI